MKFAIITGTSKGLGASIAELLMKAGVHVVGIARTRNRDLLQIARDAGVTYQHFTCNLSDVDQLDGRLKKLTIKCLKRNRPCLLD